MTLVPQFAEFKNLRRPEKEIDFTEDALRTNVCIIDITKEIIGRQTVTKDIVFLFKK